VVIEWVVLLLVGDRVLVLVVFGAVVRGWCSIEVICVLVVGGRVSAVLVGCRPLGFVCC